MVKNHGSPTEWSGSGIVLANGSPKTVVASSNETPCFLAFSAAFLTSHVNFICRSVVRDRAVCAKALAFPLPFSFRA